MLKNNYAPNFYLLSINEFAMKTLLSHMLSHTVKEFNGLSFIWNSLEVRSTSQKSYSFLSKILTSELSKINKCPV